MSHKGNILLLNNSANRWSAAQTVFLTLQHKSVFFCMLETVVQATGFLRAEATSSAEDTE